MPGFDTGTLHVFCNPLHLPVTKMKAIYERKCRYIGLPDDKDDFNFTERFIALKTEPEKQIAEEITLNALIKNNLSQIKLPEGK